MAGSKKHLTASLCIPSWNSGETLAECLRSVMKQTFHPLEIVVVDDGSSDDTASIARSFDVKLIRNSKNAGIAASRNAAIEATSGDIFLTLDADIVIPRDWVARMVKNFKGRRPIGGCCGKVLEKYQSTVADRWRAFHMPLHFGNRRSYQPRFLLCGIAAFRREVLEEVGGYDRQHRISNEDVDLSNRVRDAGYDLLYDPMAIGYHLKRSTPELIIRGFWIYWASQNERDGHYRSMAAAQRLLVARQMGIADYRIRQDLLHRNDDFLPLDLLIPLTFCVRDIDRMASLKVLTRSQATTLQGALADQSRAICQEILSVAPPPEWTALAFGQDAIPAGRADRITPAGKRYMRTFADSFRLLLQGFNRSQRARLMVELPRLMKEARTGFSRSITAWQEMV